LKNNSKKIKALQQNAKGLGNVWLPLADRTIIELFA